MFTLLKVQHFFESGTVDISAEIVVKNEDKDVLHAVMASVFHNEYEKTLESGEMETVFNEYMVEDIQEDGVETFLESMKKRDSLIIQRAIIPGGIDTVTYVIVTE